MDPTTIKTRPDVRGTNSVCHSPEPLSTVNRCGRWCDPNPPPGFYPLAAACVCGDGAIVRDAPDDQWEHPTATVPDVTATMLRELADSLIPGETVTVTLLTPRERRWYKESHRQAEQRDADQ